MEINPNGTNSKEKAYEYQELDSYQQTESHMWESAPSSSGRWTQSSSGYEYMNLDNIFSEDQTKKTDDQMDEKVVCFDITSEKKLQSLETVTTKSSTTLSLEPVYSNQKTCDSHVQPMETSSNLYDTEEFHDVLFADESDNENSFANVSSFSENFHQFQNHEENHEVSDDEDEPFDNLYEVLKAKNIPSNLSRARSHKEKSKIPKEIQGLMGTANLLYVKGDLEKARNICNQVIREAPYAPDPYLCLSMIYDNEPEISLCCRLLGTHLSPAVSSAKWQSLAEQCLQEGITEKALNCYKKALKVDAHDVELLSKIARLYLTLGQFQKAMIYYQKKIAAMPRSASAARLAYEHAVDCHDKGELGIAIKLLKAALKNHRNYFTDQHANTLCELLIMSEKFTGVLETLAELDLVCLTFTQNFCGFAICGNNSSSEQTRAVESYKKNLDFSLLSGIKIKSNINIDLKSKAIISSIQIGKKELVDEHILEVLMIDPEEIGDVHYDIAEALILKNNWFDALKIFDHLIVTQKFAEKAEIFLKRSFCFSSLGEHQNAIEDLKKCVQLAPWNVDARIKLAEAWVLLEEYRKSINALDDADDFNSTPDEQMRLYDKRFEIFKIWGSIPGKKNKLASAADVGLLMFANKLHSAFSSGSLGIVKRFKKSRNPMAGEIKLVQSKISTQNINQKYFLHGNSNYFSNTHWLRIYRELLNLLSYCKRYKEAIILNHAVMCDKQLVAKLKRQNLEMIELRLSLKSGWYSYAYYVVKEWLMKYKEVPNHMWNIFNQITIRTEDMRHHRFCIRRLTKNPNNYALRLLKGNGGIVAGKYRSALKEYVQTLKETPEDPLLHLLIGVIYIHILSQKNTKLKHLYAVQAFSFFIKYSELRGIKQESCYNIGRALQQIGLDHFAIHMYEQALAASLPDIISEEPGSSHLNLCPDIAYNLSLIYRKSGNQIMANHLLMTYCSV